MVRFTLRQLLAFVFIYCVYLATLRLIFMSAVNAKVLPWLAVVTVWLVFSVSYCYLRLTGAMFVQLTFPFALAYLVIASGGGNSPPAAIVIGCALGTLISFPVAQVTISFRGHQKN